MASEFEKKIFKAAVVNADELVKAQAKDIGDARMTESKEDREAHWFTKIRKRIWKHNLAQEWFRQREIRRAKKDILESGNLYAGEKAFDPDKNDGSAASKEALEAIVERFTSEYEEEMLKEKEQDSKHIIEGKEINENIKDLIKQYAGSNMPAASFEEQKKRILSRYDKKIASEKNLYADNLLSIANEVKDAVTHGTKIAELNFEVEITYGTARESLSTTAHQTTFDKGVEKLQNSKIGKFIANEPVALGIAAGLYEVGRNVLQKTASSKATQWVTFGAASLFAGGISAMKERARITRERAQHQRETAKGMQFKEKDMKRRQEMEKNSYDTKQATIIIENLNIDLAKIREGNTSKEELDAAMGHLADLEARIKLNNQESIDLITYDKFTTLEKDRNAMNQKRAELKVALRNHEGMEEFDTQLGQLVETQKKRLLEGEHGIERQDETFRKLRNKSALKAFVKTTLVSATIGTAFQETKALFDGAQDGIIEGGIKHFTNKEDLVKHGTALEGLRRWMSGEHTTMPTDAAHLHEEVFDTTHVQLPEGVTFEQNPDTTYNLVRDGEVISDHLRVTLDAQGNLSEETREALAKSGITTDFGLIGSKTTEIIHQSAQEYVNHHPELTRTVHRELWYDNDTAHPFDKNELRTDWGGVNGSGIDAKGNYVFNISRMTADGSFHGDMSVDAHGELQKGGLKMLFSLSKDTQHQVFEVSIDADGNAIIDPNSELGKLMFVENSDGHAVFTGKFAEVAQSTGTAPDGGENVRILGTHIGQGKDMIDDVVSTDTTTAKVLFHIPDDNTYAVPPTIPITGRRPLERGTYEKNRVVEASRPKHQEDQEPDTAGSPGTAASTPTSLFDAEVAQKMKYSAKSGFSGTPEIPVAKETDHIYGFNMQHRKEIEARLKDIKKYTHPEIFLFESDKKKREENVKFMADLKKWNPKARFVYVPLPKNVTRLESKKMKTYFEKRFENIVTASKVPDKIKRELHIELAPTPLGPVSDGEWKRFMDTGKVPAPRLQDIARKIQSGQLLLLTDKEQAMRAEQHEAVEKLLKKNPLF